MDTFQPWSPEPCGFPPTTDERRINEHTAPCKDEARWIIQSGTERSVACPKHLEPVVEKKARTAPQRTVSIKQVGF